MSLFKNKRKEPTILVLLESEYKRASENKQKSFYYALFDRDKKYAENFCKKHYLKMELDHVSDGNYIYKFIILKN